jgi:chemotaxis signal transduction protein
LDPWSDSGRRRELDLVLFVIGGRTYGADAGEVHRVARRDPELPTASRLGDCPGNRALRVSGRGGEVQVPIERLLGIRPAPLTALRRLPAFAKGLIEPAVVGFLLEEGQLVLLLDLQALIEEDNCSAAASEAEAGLGRLGA